jgi:hypothetical protein
MDRMKLYGGGNSPRDNQSDSPTKFKINQDQSAFHEIMQPSSSPRAMKFSKLDIVDIPGA